MKLIPRLQNGQSSTFVAKQKLIEKVPYKLKDNERWINGQLVQLKDEQVDNQSNEPKILKEEREKQLSAKESEKQRKKNTQKGLENFGGFMNFTTRFLPSQIAGAVKKGQSFGDYVANGNEGIGGNVVLNTAFDLGSGYVGMVGNNLLNRNLFFYKYIDPFSYSNPLSRGSYVVKKMFTRPTPNRNNIQPSYKQLNFADRPYLGRMITGNITENDASATKLVERFRDAAYRKYLGIPEKEPIYIPNEDGTFSYNLPYIEKLYKEYDIPFKVSDLQRKRGIDYITGNGGRVNIKTHSLSGPYEVDELFDVWDLNPFQDHIFDLNKPIRNAANKVYTKLYNPLYKSRFGYNYFGGSYLNRLRYGLDSNALKFKFPNIEASKIMGGKPFTMKTEVPLTKSIKFEQDLIENKPYPYWNIEYGFKAEPYEMYPQKVLEYKKHGVLPIQNNNLNNNLNIDLSNLTTKTVNTI